MILSAKLGRRLLFGGREGEHVGHADQLVDLGLMLGVRGEVRLELASLVLGDRAERVGVLELFEARSVHPVHLGTATSRASK